MVAVNLPGYRERAAILGIGLLGNSLLNNCFDYALYPYVIWKLGPINGTALMTALAFLACYASILFYDWAKKDWLGIETIKELRENTSNSRFMRAVRWAANKGDAALLIFLSIWTDAFITVAYMRKGAHQYNGMTTRDWRIFMLSLAVSNIFWGITVFTGMTATEYAWSAISSALQ